MPINFTKIFQDSWNFIQNQRQITLTFLSAFFISNVVISILLEATAATDPIPQGNEELSQVLGISAATPSTAISILIYQFLYVLLSSWCLVSIHNISQKGTFSLAYNLSHAMKRVVGVLLINIILLLPIIIGVSEIFFSLIITKQQSSIFSLLSLAFGVYLFIRFCLASVHYLIANTTIGQAFQITWRASTKRVAPLFLYCLILHFLLPLLMRHLSALGINLVLELVIELITAFLIVFSLVFTYRFYTIFMQKA